MLLTEFKGLIDMFSTSQTPNKVEESIDPDNLKVRDFNIYYKNIRESLETDEQKESISKIDFVKLQSELIYRFVLFSETPFNYLLYIKVINDACRTGKKYFINFSKVGNWKIAISNCKYYLMDYPSTFRINRDRIRDDYPRDFDVATSIKNLIRYGCKVEIVNSDFRIFRLEKVASILDNKIKKIGGLYVVNKLFELLHQNGSYSQDLERYLVIRNSTIMSNEQTPKIPFGYLFNLSTKYPYENTKIVKLTNINQNFNEIIELSINIANALDVQQYNIMEYHFHSGDTIIGLFTDIALWDSVFSIPQCRPSHALEIATELFTFIDDTIIKSQFGFSKEELFTIAKYIYLNNSASKSSILIYVSTIKKINTQIEPKKIKKILDFLSHENVANKDYLIPSDYTSIDFFLKPLIKQGEGKYILLNRSWCSLNLFEAMAFHLRPFVKNLDAKLGFELEYYIERIFNKKGISFSKGDYETYDKKKGECDFVVETNSTILLIEFKKKVLTRKAKSGIDNDIIIDLTDSILAAQLQTGRTEIELRKKGEIVLTDKNNISKTIQFRGRNIERVALTQLEFGGFNDRVLFKQLFNALLTHSFFTNSQEEKIKEKFKQLSKYQEVFVNQYNTLVELDNTFHSNPFFNCWFYSLPQFLEILRKSTNNESFCKNLLKTKRISFSTLDWYYEFSLIPDKTN